MTLFRDEKVSERAVGFTCTFGVQSNVLGNNPKTRLSDWIEKDSKIYPVSRSEPWEPKDNIEDEKTEKLIHPHFVRNTEPPPELFNLENQTHDNIEMVSLIRERLWNRAKWTGTIFLSYERNAYPPVFAFVFRDQDAGRQIFENWRKEFGEVDEKEEIRLVIVKGIDKENPNHYRVTIGSNPTAAPKGVKFVGFVFRNCQMNATTPDNLNRFLQARNAVDAFFIAPAFAPSGLEGGKPPEIGGRDLFILIHQIHERNAWEIGLKDEDSIAIHKEDNPIIPEGISDPPVIKLLEYLRKNIEI